MNKNSIIDWTGYIFARAAGPVIRSLPLGAAYSIGRRMGDLLWCLDHSHRRLVQAHMRKALGPGYSPAQISALSRRCYQGLGQSAIELLLIPKIDKDFISRNIRIEGREHLDAAMKRKNGIIMLSVHSGSWELSNIICASLGMDFRLFVRDQRMPRLSGLLNGYRRHKGLQVIEREGQVRELVRALKNNEAVGMSQDQGGKAGILVDFFGRKASMPSGAVTLALRYGAVIVPAFYSRLKGPQVMTTLFPPFEPSRSGDEQKDIRDNVQALVKLFEGCIRQHPGDYLWTYRLWKYGNERKVLIISDGKTGHLRQSQAVSRLISRMGEAKGIQVSEAVVEVSRKAGALDGKTREAIAAASPDIVVSCGSSVAGLNRRVSREYAAKSVSVMRPGILGTRHFDAVIMPWHDRPPKRGNIAVTAGAMNLIDFGYLSSNSRALRLRLGIPEDDPGQYIGLLLGGDTRHFTLSAQDVAEVVQQLKAAAEKLDAYLLVTTSRRTSPAAAAALKEGLECYPRCKLLVVANENNIPEAVGGILGMSRAVITSPESISMVSEAASSGASTVVFARRLDRRHRIFLEHLSRNRHIALEGISGLSSRVERLWQGQGGLRQLDDRAAAAKALERII